MCWGKNIWGLGLSVSSCHYQNVRFATAALLSARSVDFHNKLEITNNYEGLTKAGPQSSPKVTMWQKNWSFDSGMTFKFEYIYLSKMFHYKWTNRKLYSRIRQQFVSNKAEGQISKRVLQEDRARQIFRKTNIFYPLIPHYIITTPMIKIFLYFNEDLNKGRYMQVSPAFAFPYNKNINRKFMIIVSNIRNWCQKKLKTRTLRLETSF